MGTFTSLIRRAPKRFSAVVAMIAAAIIVPAVVLAWGPDRPTYTIEQPADHVTFNSITNNPNYGDERNFVTIKDNTFAGPGNWVDEITVQNNKEYTVRMYVHNNAASNLNLVAQNVAAKFSVPTYSAKNVQIDGFLSSSNATPGVVFDQANFKSNTNFNLSYVAGSAKYINNVFTSGTALPDSVVSTGATLGYTQMDGNIPGCFQYSGLVVFTVKATTTDFSVDKTVRINGATDKTFKESVDAKAGDKVDYQVHFKNTGGTRLNGVVIKDTLPAGVTYVKDSTYVNNSNGTVHVGDGVTGGGLIIGDYLPNGDGYVKFTAQVAANDSLPICGPNTLKNVAKATTDAGSKEDTANVVVPKACEKDITVCELATKKIVTIKESQFDAKKYSKNLDDCKTPGKITVCEIATKKIVTIDESQFTDKYTKDLSKCATTPPELPKTGPSENIVALIGLGALIASIGYYLASRRASLNR